jgi:hypothetical protein
VGNEGKEPVMQQATTRELAYRANDGVEVALLWSPTDDRLTVVVQDTKADERFELEAQADNALDVFYHPYVYAPRAAIEATAVAS